MEEAALEDLDPLLDLPNGRVTLYVSKLKKVGQGPDRPRAVHLGANRRGCPAQAVGPFFRPPVGTPPVSGLNLCATLAIFSSSSSTAKPAGSATFTLN